MKKTLLILFLIIINYNLFSQTKRLDEIIFNNNKIHFNYDSTNKYLGAQLLALNTDGINWDLQSEINVSYNVDNLVSTEIDLEWDGTTMINNGKVEFAYDTAQNIINSTEYDWNNTTNNWENAYNIAYNYDSGNLISEITENHKIIYTYDLSNKLILKEFYYWDDTNNIWDTVPLLKYEFIFDNNTLRQEQFVYSEDNWNCEENVNFTYNNIFLENDLILPFKKGMIRVFFVTSYTDMETEFEILNCDGSSGGIYTFQYSDLALSLTNNEFVELNIYPNPTTNQVKFDITDFEKIEIYDITGKLITKTETNIANMENVPNGTYLYRIQKGNETISGKIIKK